MYHNIPKNQFSMAGTSITPFLVTILLLVVVLFTLSVVAIQKRKPGSTDIVKKESLTAGSIGSWVIVGTGLTAAVVLQTVPKYIHNAMTLREGTENVGGRILSTPLAVTPPSTKTPSQEFGGWVYEPFTHQGTFRFLKSLNILSVAVELHTSYTFTYDKGVRKPYSSLPPRPSSNSVSFKDVASSDPVLWFAHTGIWVHTCPEAEALSIYNLNMPLYGDTIAGFGWKEVIFRCIGTTPTLYGRVLETIGIRGDGNITLNYASGNSEYAAGVVLTMSPVQLKQVKGFLPSFEDILSTSFVSVSAGTIYAAWSSQESWWQSLGFFSGAVATSLPIGRVFVISPNELRLNMSGDEHVAFWTNVFLNDGVDAAKTEIAKQLSEVFGIKVPLPSSSTYKSWPSGYTFWKAGKRTETVSRPFGEKVPVFWASGDTSNYSNMIGGCINSGSATANEITKYITSLK